MNFMECCGGHLMSPMSVVEQPTPWCVHLIWALAVITVTAIIAHTVLKILENMSEAKKAEADAARKFESEMKEKSFEKEKWWHSQKDCNTDSQKAKLEFEQQLEFERKLWDKLLREQEQPADIVKKFEDLKNQFEKLKAEYPKLRLNVEISEKNNGQEAK